jgi:hypothetical protein
MTARQLGVWRWNFGTSGSNCEQGCWPRRRPSRSAGGHLLRAGQRQAKPRDPRWLVKSLAVLKRKRRKSLARPAVASSRREHAARDWWTESLSDFLPSWPMRLSSFLSCGAEWHLMRRSGCPEEDWQVSACSEIVMAGEGRCWDWGRGRSLPGSARPFRYSVSRPQATQSLVLLLVSVF